MLLFSEYVKVGHAQTFHIAQQRADQCGGYVILRVEDLDSQRCKSHFYDDMLEDLRWMGVRWKYGPGAEDSPLPRLLTGTLEASEQGPISADYRQSRRMDIYKSAWRRLLASGCIYPSSHSRKDVDAAISAPHEGDSEVIFPPSLRPAYANGTPGNAHFPEEIRSLHDPAESKANWRFRVPDGEAIEFEDGRCGMQRFVAGRDFGDFLVWRGADGIPSYECAVVVDDVDMGVTEVVRGEDLLLSTARQILIYRILADSLLPAFYHCPLVRNAEGQRLAKRSFSQSLRTLRDQGYSMERVMAEFFDPEVLTKYPYAKYPVVAGDASPGLN